MYNINMKRGFTLIELLVVISIISLLSTVVLVSVQDARQRAEYRKFGSELVQLRNALQLYAQDHGGDYGTGSSGSEPFFETITRLYNGGYIPTDIQMPDYLNTGYTGFETGFFDNTFSGASVGCEVNGNVEYLSSGFVIWLHSNTVDLKSEVGLGEAIINTTNLVQSGLPNTQYYCLIQN
jgi:prepilin-type N-terminal cleavage/methylation domain-containing protein